MKYRLSVILMLLFLLGYSQVVKAQNNDEEFINYVYNYYPKNSRDSEGFNKKLIEFPKLIQQYESKIKENPTQRQLIYLKYAKLTQLFPKPGYIELVDQLIPMIGKSTEFPKILSICYRNKAVYLINKDGGDVNQILAYYHKAVDVAKGDKVILTKAYINLSDFYEIIYDDENKLKYLNLAIQNSSKQLKGGFKKEKDFLSELKLKKALYFFRRHSYSGKKADIDSANLIVKNLLKGKDIACKSGSYMLKAYSETINQNYPQAIRDLDSSFVSKYYKVSLRNYVDESFGYGLLSYVYFKMNNLEKGQFYLGKVKGRILDGLVAKNLYEEAYLTEKRLGNYENALAYLEEKNASERIRFNYKNQTEIKKFQEKLKVAEKDVQLAQLQTNKKSLTIGVIIIVNLLLIGTVLSIIYFRRKEKQLKKVENEIRNFTENEIYKINYAKDQAVSHLRKQFSSQLHNDVGSILVATSSFLKSKKKLENNEEDKELWDDISEELHKVYNIVRNESHQIYDSSFDNAQFLTDLEKNIRVIFSGQSIELHTKISIEKEKSLTPEIKLCILSTMREACTNILKYAKAKNVSINLTNDDNNIYLEISNDSKKRTPKTKQVSLGIGLINLNEQIKTLNGVFKASHIEDGFIISANIPLK